MAKDKSNRLELWAQIDGSGVAAQTGQRGFYRPLPEEKAGPYRDVIVKFRCEVIISAQVLQKRDERGRLVDLIKVIGAIGDFVKEVPLSSGNEPGTWNTIQTEDVR